MGLHGRMHPGNVKPQIRHTVVGEAHGFKDPIGHQESAVGEGPGGVVFADNVAVQEHVSKMKLTASSNGPLGAINTPRTPTGDAASKSRCLSPTIHDLNGSSWCLAHALSTIKLPGFRLSDLPVDG